MTTGRRHDAEAYFIALDGKHDHLNVIADADLFSFIAQCKTERRVYCLQRRYGRFTSDPIRLMTLKENILPIA